MPRERYAALLEALGLCLAARITPLVSAGPGVGKTSVIESLQQQGIHVETVVCSHYEPVDFSGLPVVTPAGDVQLAPPAWARRVAEFEGISVVFFDEWSTAAPSTQAAALRPLTHFEVGSLRLPESVRFIAASNPADVAAGGWELKPPTANRFCHLDWVLPHEVFNDGIVSGIWPQLTMPSVVDSSLQAELDVSRAAAAGFLAARPTLLNAMPKDPLAQGGAFPTPRTWDYATRLLAWGRATGSRKAAIELAVAGVIGLSTGHEFLTWIRQQDLPDPETLLDDPDGFSFEGMRPDRVHMILQSLVARVSSTPSPERWTTAVVLCAKAAEQSSLDAAVPAVRSLIRPEIRPPGSSVPAQISIFAAPLALAGLMPEAAA